MTHHSAVPTITMPKSNETRVLRDLSVDFYKAYKLSRDKYNEYDENV